MSGKKDSYFFLSLSRECAKRLGTVDFKITTLYPFYSILTEVHISVSV